MVVGELFVAMRDAELLQSPNEPAGTVKQVELIVLAAVDVERLQPAEVVALSFDCDDRVLPHPICPAFLDDLAGVGRDRQPDPEELGGIGIVAGCHRQCVHYLEGTLGMLSGALELLPPFLDGVLGPGERAQDRRHVGQITELESHIARMTGGGRPNIGMTQCMRYRAITAGALAEHAASTAPATS